MFVNDEEFLGGGQRRHSFAFGEVFAVDWKNLFSQDDEQICRGIIEEEFLQIPNLGLVGWGTET